MSVLKWIHLSDIHFRNDLTYNYTGDIILENLLNDIEMKIDNDFNPDFIVITGDIANKAKNDEYIKAESFLDNLRKRVNNLDKNRVFIIPGNHDINKNTTDKSIIKGFGEYLKNIEQIIELYQITQFHEVIYKRLENYAFFIEKYFGSNIDVDKRYHSYVKYINDYDKKIAILGLNSAWISCGETNEYGKLLIGRPQITDALRKSNDADIRIALIHHPFEWLKPFDRTDVENWMKNKCAYILNGHNHKPNVRIEKSFGGTSCIVPGGSCYHESEHHYSYNYAELDLDTLNSKFHVKCYNPDLKEWVDDTMSTRNEKGIYQVNL